MGSDAEIETEPPVYVNRRDQRKTALQMANERRSEIAKLKRKLGDREVDPVHVLNQRDHPWHEIADSMQVQDFLMAIRGFGHKTVDEILADFGVSGKMHIDRLNAQRRKELIRLIELLQA